MNTEVTIALLQVKEEIEEFCAFLKSEGVNRMIEIGAHQGGTAVHFCETVKGLVVSVDLPGGDGGGLPLDQCRARNVMLSRMYKHFRGVLGDSHQPTTLQAVTDILGDVPVDCLFIDGDHSYDGVKQDYEMYRGLVKPGGWVAFHDINDTEVHRNQGCRVDLFWNELDGEKREFNVHSKWGGIGAIRA